MLKEIKYVCSETPDIFTCHSLFSRITNQGLSKIKVNQYTKQPVYSISYTDRVITLIIEDEDLEIISPLIKNYKFNHNGGQILLELFSIENFYPINIFKNDDYVQAEGVISLSKKLTNPISFIDTTTGRNVKRSRVSPIDSKGNFNLNQRERTLKYLEEKTGLDIMNPQIDNREHRFEMISYKNFEKKNKVFSKTNANSLSIHNVFYFNISGYVKDSELANSLQYNSIGQKRSYGFGNVNLYS